MWINSKFELGIGSILNLSLFNLNRFQFGDKLLTCKAGTFQLILSPSVDNIQLLFSPLLMTTTRRMTLEWPSWLGMLIIDNVVVCPTREDRKAFTPYGQSASELSTPHIFITITLAITIVIIAVFNINKQYHHHHHGHYVAKPGRSLACQGLDSAFKPLAAGR